MSPLLISLVSFFFILGGAMTGFFLGKRLPEPHLSQDSKESVKMAWGIVATMSALVLGLLVASAKESFDDMDHENTQAAARIIALHHILLRYGHEADAVRVELRKCVFDTIRNDWQEDDFITSDPSISGKQNGMEKVRDMLSNLTPSTGAQHSLLDEAIDLSRDLSLSRWLFIEQTRTLLPNALLIALVFWLSILFMGMAMFAPHNKTVLCTLVVCSFAVSVSILLINDLSHPLKGFVIISSRPLRDALQHLDQN